MSGEANTSSDGSNFPLDQWDNARDEEVSMNMSDKEYPNRDISNSVVISDHTDIGKINSLDERVKYIAEMISKFPRAYQRFEASDNISMNDAFEVANILHTDRHVFEASELYRLAFDLHDKQPNHYPLAQSLLQVRLLCLLKSGHDLPETELIELDKLCIPYGNYLRGVRAAWQKNSLENALNLIGNAFEEFHTGEEIDSIYLELAMKHTGRTIGCELNTPGNFIPYKMYMYWDKLPPQEIVDNFEYHKNLHDLPVKIFDREEAAEWLYQKYGIEARELFLNARHPAEAADFLRVHIINLLGGWWLDADLKLKKDNYQEFMKNFDKSGCYFTTSNNVIHNDFFGSSSNSVVLNDCLLSLYRNNYLHKGLFIAYKTGPGIFNRALSRIYHNALSIDPNFPSIEIYNQNDFDNYIEEFDTPYKHNTPHWQSV
ncbi:glycosyltransferase family 32 protein [Gluconobacter oxydans]|uniref:hypothetical protein n=1 Tax=Gluconobacter oxydans TaxID=442 RepID=UPI0012DA2942|nr:hypothetical protein [Gluconobacter oxydans]